MVKLLQEGLIREISIMKKKLKCCVLSLVLFIAGCLCGVVLTALLFQRNVISPFYSNALLEIAFDVRQLSQGQAEHVLERKVKAVPFLTETYYEHYYKFMPNDNSRYAPLWQVQEYYLISGDTVPSQIKPILESLPQRPLTFCEFKRSKDSNSIETNDVQ
jgi:hypothetical protein